jgi:hypothetical protein
VPAFHPDQGRDAPLPERAPHLGLGRHELERLRVLVDDAQRDVDLFELDARIAGVANLARDVDRPELRADHPAAEPVEVRVAGRATAEVVGVDVARANRVLTNAPRKIVVPVGERGCAKNAPCDRDVAGGGLGCWGHGLLSVRERRARHESGYRRGGGEMS